MIINDKLIKKNPFPILILILKGMISLIFIKIECFLYLKFKLIFLMFDNLTTFLLAFTLQHQINDSVMHPIDESVVKNCSFTSRELLDQIFTTLNSTENYKDDRQHKLSLSSDETRSHTQTKCNCKKSKCLKLYCECFAQGKPSLLPIGSLCQGCNC